MRCPRCGLANPDGFRFCGACGADLAGADTAPQQERKLVSALFCDLVGFTPRAEGMDPEDVHRMLRTYYARVSEEFVRFGGTVAKYIGDAVFVLFGAPRAHEDDPERAVRAALAGVDAVAALNADDPRLDLHVHIGVTTGEALVTFGAEAEDREGLAWGDILNTAARLEAAAPADSILVDDATYRATRQTIDYARVEPVHAKGIAEPVEAWRPIAPVARRGLDLVAGDADRPPLIGRDAELSLMLELLDEVRERRRPQLITVVGEPGIGKSALIVELFAALEARVELTNWRQGRSPPYPEGIAFWALGEIVKGQAGVLATDGADVAERKLARAVADLVPDTAEAARVEGHLRSLVGLAPAPEARGDQRGAAFAAWRHFLQALARRRTLVVVFEDVHWADDGQLDFVEHLLGWARDVPLLILCSARPELLERRPDWGDSPEATTLTLEPLSESESEELVGALAGERAVSGELMAEIVASAAGNPLYSVEFVRMLAARGLLDPGPQRTTRLPVPDSVRGIISARLDALSADDKGLLLPAAVVGRAVWPGALAALTEQEPPSVLRGLESLAGREFLVRTPVSAIEREPEYRFRHVLIRDVAYNAMPRRRRGEMHRRAARWLQSISRDRGADRAEMLAYHFQRAYDLARTTGEEVGSLRDDARRALRDAGDRALTLHAYPVAARRFQAALDLWPEDDPERPSLLFRLGRALYYAETGGGQALTAARDTLLEAGDRGAAAEAEVFLAYLAHHEGQRDRVFEHLERAIALVEDMGPTRARAEVYADLANYLSMARDHERTIAAASEALRIARALGLREVEATALYTIGISRGLSGDLGGRDDLRRSIAITEEIDSQLAAQCCGVLADLECNLGNLRECFALQARARAHAERFGHAGFVRWLEAERVAERYWTGEWHAAVAAADGFIAEAESRPHFMNAYCRTMRGRIRLARGDRDGAREDGARAVELARSAQDPQMLYPALAFCANVTVASEARAEGERLAGELLDLWRARPDAFPVSSWSVDLACALRQVGRGAELREIAGAVAMRTQWLHAVVALADGEVATAAERFAAIGSRPDEALARLVAAEALAAEGRAAEARREAEPALTFFVAVGGDGYAARASAAAGGPIATDTAAP
jgi:class 3 adenylate cyclase/tetratricopeptide (TPR) repeat protein